MLSTKSPDHHVKSGVSGPPAVAVHGVAPAAAAEVIFKGLSFNNVGPIVGAVQGFLFFVISGETSICSPNLTILVTINRSIRAINAYSRQLQSLDTLDSGMLKGCNRVL